MKNLIINDLKKTIDRVLTQKSSTAVLKNKRIQLHLFRENTSIIYRCAIAHQLTTILNGSALEIADLLVKNIESNLEIKVLPPGWIDFHYRDRHIADWLERLSSFQLSENQQTQLLPRAKEVDSDRLFIIQYAHARCCSLLLLGEKINLIELKDKQFTEAVWQISSPVSWLDEEGNLRSIHPTEIYLIERLFAVMDELCCSESKNLFKQIILLSEALLKLWDDCRIYGDTSKKTPQLAKARLGLVATTQFLLKMFLEQLVGISALIQL
jgi:arginyl-tRNA synthetase